MLYVASLLGSSLKSHEVFRCQCRTNHFNWTVGLLLTPVTNARTARELSYGSVP